MSFSASFFNDPFFAAAATVKTNNGQATHSVKAMLNDDWRDYNKGGPSGAVYADYAEITVLKAEAEALEWVPAPHDTIIVGGVDWHLDKIRDSGDCFVFEVHKNARARK